jgi:hypothetical protein
MEATGSEVQPERKEHGCDDDQSDVANGNATEKQTEQQIHRVRLIDTPCFKLQQQEPEGAIWGRLEAAGSEQQPERSEYGCVRLRAVHVRSQQQLADVPCVY